MRDDDGVFAAEIFAVHSGFVWSFRVQSSFESPEIEYSGVSVFRNCILENEADGVVFMWIINFFYSFLCKRLPGRREFCF